MAGKTSKPRFRRVAPVGRLVVDSNARDRILLDAYSAALDPDGLADAISKLLDMVGTPFGGMPIFWSPYHPDFALWRGPPPLAAGLPLEHAQNPVLTAVAGLPVGVAIRYEEEIKGADSTLSIIHKHMDGLKHTAQVNISLLPDCHCGLVLHRHVRFGEDELGFIVGLVPHLRGILSLYRPAGEKRILEAALLAIESAGFGIILVDSQRRPVFATCGAERLLRKRDGVCIERGRVCAAEQQDSAEFERQLSDAIATGEGRVTGYPRSAYLRRADGGSLRLSVIPLLQGDGRRTAPRAALVLTATASVGLSVRALQDQHGLTLAESRVVARLAQGKSLAAIAKEMGVALATVRSHLYRSFEKTGATRQAELVALVSGNRARA